MRKLAAMVGVFGVVAGAAALPENNSSLAPLTSAVGINNLLAEAVVVADVSSTVAPAVVTQKYDAAISVCGAAVPVTHRDYSNANMVAPMAVIATHLFSKGISIQAGEAIVVTAIEAPKHGALISDGYTYGNYEYRPNDGYLGPDQMTFVVEVMGKKFKVIETVWVANTAPEYGGCPADYKLPPAITGNEELKGSASK